MSLDDLQVVGAIGVNEDGSARVSDGSTRSLRLSEGTYRCTIESEIGVNEALPIATPWFDLEPVSITLVVRMEDERNVRVICYSTETNLVMDFPFNLLVYRFPQMG